MTQRSINRVDDLISFLQTQDKSLPIVVQINDDESDQVASAAYECHRIVLELAGYRSPAIVELEDDIENLERDLDEALNKVEDLEKELAEARKAK